jgi:hypothetical protein
MRKWVLFSLLVAAGIGCNSTLETGYEPRRLAATDGQRRAYYSSPYSEETQQALDESSRFDVNGGKPTRY